MKNFEIKKITELELSGQINGKILEILVYEKKVKILNRAIAKLNKLRYTRKLML